MLEHFYCHPGILNYNFGERHPLKPERLRRTLELLGAMIPVNVIESTMGTMEDLFRVHSAEYVAAVRSIDVAIRSGDINEDFGSKRVAFGFGSQDNPPFAGMFQAALDYVGSTASAARAVCAGAPVAFAIGGGLHHAARRKASGFCIFNDPAIACHILRERFSRVAYVDIDVHHGDGVQAIFENDPSVLTCSIHENPRTLFPGTGFVEETGVEFSALNVPIAAKSTGDVWIEGFRSAIVPALDRWKPEAIVLQLGTDIHYLDPLGHLNCLQQHWIAAVSDVMGLGLPIVAMGGGGYSLNTVPRMWVSAILRLSGHRFDDRLPNEFAQDWGVETFSDRIEEGQSVGGEFLNSQLAWLRENHALLN